MAASGLSCNTQNLRCSEQASLGTRASLYLQHSGSVVASQGLSCPLACRILVPQPGIKSVSPALEG